MKLKGKRVSILGAGDSGRAAAALALRHGAEVHVFDQRETIEGLPEGAVGHAAIDIDAGFAERCDLLVVSPGIDTYGPLVGPFVAGAGEAIGELEFASRFFEGRIVAVTGTNGKTTTTELVQRILAAGGIEAVACGNYGVPMSEVVARDPQPDALALEASSFQLETIVDFRPQVAVWLNFAPDHMDRYPDVDAYRRAKLRVFMNQSADDVAVVRAGEELPELAARVVRFSPDDGDVEWFFDGREIRRDGEAVLDLERDSHLRGRHNAENAMAAMAAGEAMGIDLDAMRGAFDGYAPPRHRCELVRTLDGVEWLNDSKATNLHALECAIRSQNRPVVLIAGGKNKGLDYRPLLPLLAERCEAAVTIGEIGRPLADLFNEVIEVEALETLGEAIGVAHRLAPAGSCVLFSPGTSSFDQFDGYQARGDEFCRLVNLLR